MTQNQLEWMQQSGLDPAEYDMTPDGRVVRRQVASAPAEPQREVMSPLRAAGTSFLGNLLPSAAGLYAGAQTGALGGSMFGPVGTVLGGIGGGLAGGYGAGKLQEKALEEFAPEALQQLAQAEQDQPVMSYLGGFAPNALALKPSFGGIKGLTAPLGSMSKDAARAAFLPAAANVGVNVAGSTAGQLINMSQGGEFSAPRFAADVALGSLFADPTKLGRRFGLTPLKPDVAAAESPMDLAALRTAAAESSEAARVAGEAESARIMDETRGQMSAGGMTGREVELFKSRPEMEWWKQPEATRIADIERVAKETKQRLPKGMVAELAGLPEVYDVVQNPEKFPQFLATSLEEALNAAHERGVQDRFLRPEDAEIMGRYQDNRLEVMAQKEALKPTPEEAAKAEAIQAENARVEAEQNAAELRKLQDLEAAQALSDEAAERLQVLKSRRAELLYANRGERPNIRQNIREQSDPAITQAKQELADARAIADDLYSRLQRPGGEGLLSQAALDAAAQLAARRGLRIVPAPPEQQARGIRGAYVVNENGERVIYINPLAATADTAIHEIGHDVFKTSPNERMQRSLMDTAEGSEAYRREYEARLAEGKTEQVARDLALEEGLVQAFGEQHPNVKPGEIRQWFNALKSSVKSMIGMKLSPEDALAWMHYATTEAVPWKGVAVAKTGDVGGERMQRGSELFGLTNEDFAPSSDPKFLHATHLEQNNPTGLRVAAREPSGKVTIGKLGDLHMDLPTVTENSEFGFVDKTGNFLTREQASAQRANPDIRYQRSILSEAKTPAELDYLASKGGPFADVATNVKAAYNTRDFKQGQWSSKFSLTSALPEEARVRLFNHLAGEFDSGVRSTPASDIRAAYDQLRNEYLPAIVNDYNAQGFTVRDTAGQRARGTNPTYFPLHSVADDVERILTTMQGSPEWDKLKADFINWNTQLRQADGASLAEAQRYADEKFQERVGITSKPPGIESGIPFSGARKPEGYPLPPSWRSNDIIDILNNYTRRSATDFAYQQHVESSPVAMAALGAKTMLNNQPIPANVLQSTPLIINEPSVQSVLREYRGTPAQRTDGALQSFGRFVSASTIGPVSKVGDIGTSMFKGLAYLQGSEYASGLADFTKRIGDWAALKERSYASGLNKRDAAENMRQVLGIAEDSTAFMDKAARVLSKATFVNDLESAARVIAQGWGETIVGINKKLALSGDKNATQMLDTLTKDWRTRSDADLAAQVGRLLQGSYDMRQLPASVLEGAAAPYLTWSKWSIGQYDSFVKYAIQPALQGNMKPLIGQMLIGVLGGGAISAVQEWLNNREGKDISWKELESWMQQNQGELGADGGQLLGQKLLSMAQKMGTFGFAGDLVKMTLDAYAGGASQGIATMPAIDAIYDVSKRAAAAGKALDDGEDFGLVLKALLQDSLTGHVQALRVARNWLDEDENLRYDDRRKRRLFDELTGLPNKGGTFAVNYSNLSEREFERGEITEKTGEEAFSLVSRAREEATTPEDYASRIRKYKTSQNQIMPSLERQPMKAARYLSFVEGAEEGAGAETLKRYLTREQENKYRKSLIEGMSGLR
jgi:hypothetical protein